MEPIEIAANSLRRAVAAGSYEQALARAEEYGRAVRDTLRRLKPDDPRLAGTVREALDLLEWARRVALSSRAHCAGQVAELPDLRPYRAPAAARHTWTMEG